MFQHFVDQVMRHHFTPEVSNTMYWTTQFVEILSTVHEYTYVCVLLVDGQKPFLLGQWWRHAWGSCRTQVGWLASMSCNVDSMPLLLTDTAIIVFIVYMHVGKEMPPAITCKWLWIHEYFLVKSKTRPAGPVLLSLLCRLLFDGLTDLGIVNYCMHITRS